MRAPKTFQLNWLSEDTRVYCMGWKPLIHENCTRMNEFNYQTAEQREANQLKLGGAYHIYSGGGYELRLKGQIKKLNLKLKHLQENNWIDNRTRALITEFSVYNAQANLFGIVKIVAEFIGGGISPVYRIDVIRLTRNMDFGGYVVTTCEVLFLFATFYYVLNSISSLKALGLGGYFKEPWNIVDVFTIFFSIVVVALWGLKVFLFSYLYIIFFSQTLKVIELTKQIGKTAGNAFVPIEKVMQINSYYDYSVSITVFTSMLKFCRLLRYHHFNHQHDQWFLTVSRKPSSKLLLLSNFASSVSQPSSSSLSSSLDPSAASSSLSSVLILEASLTSPTLSKTHSPWPSESSILPV